MSDFIEFLVKFTFRIHYHLKKNLLIMRGLFLFAFTHAEYLVKIANWHYHSLKKLNPKLIYSVNCALYWFNFSWKNVPLIFFQNKFFSQIHPPVVSFPNYVSKPFPMKFIVCFFSLWKNIATSKNLLNRINIHENSH